MKTTRLLLLVTMTALASACSNIEHSRNLANPKVSGITIAQQVCSLCHGVDGNAISPNFPSLAGQQPAYLVAQMQEFRSHNRLDPAGFEYMWGLSRSLTDDQIAGLADFFSAQKIAAPAQGISDVASLTAGRIIYESGVPNKNVPACASCHGDMAQGNGIFPQLVHQHADYTVKQLMVFQRTDERPLGSIMKTVVHDLTKKNIEDVAAYLQVFSTH